MNETPIPADVDAPTLAALVQACCSINRLRSAEAVYEEVVKQAAEVLDAKSASVLLFDRGSHELVFTVAVGGAGDDLVGRRLSADEGIAGQVVRTRRAVRIDDAVGHDNFCSKIDVESNLYTRCLMAAPLLSCDDVFGVLEVMNACGETYSFSENDLAVLRVFAEIASSAIGHIERYERVRSAA